MDRISILTLNIWNNEGPWDARRELIRDWLRLLEPDLVAFQEVLDSDGYHQADELLAGFDYQVDFACPMTWNRQQGTNMGNLIASRWPFARMTPILLPLGGRDDQRVLLGADVDSPFGRLPFYTTHLTSKLQDGHIREAQVSVIGDVLLARRREGDLPIVLCGDFNAEPDSSEMRYLRGQQTLDDKRIFLMDAWRVGNDSGEGYTFSRRNPYRAYRQFDQRLDYIYVERVAEDAVRIAHCDVVCDQPRHGVYPSDHFGIYLELSLAAPA